MQNNTILRVKAVAARLDISAGTVWNKCNPKSRHYDPAFPRPFKISANATGWLEAEIDEWISQRAASRL